MDLNKKPSSEKSSTVKSPSADSNALTFKFFSDLDSSDSDKASRISELTRRLANLEKFFGAGSSSVGDSQINKLFYNIENKTLLVRVYILMD